MGPVQEKNIHELIIDAMRAWFEEQGQSNHSPTPWADTDQMDDATLDGVFDLEDLASRIEFALGAAGRLRPAP